MRRRVRLLLLWCVAGAGAGCGPVESQSIQWRVEKRLERAEKLGADRSAPYEYTAARRYLHKGKEEAGYADFESAIDYFHKARLLAKKAEEKAEASAKMAPPPRDASPAGSPSRLPSREK